jgi:hypothetical protein
MATPILSANAARRDSGSRRVLVRQLPTCCFSTQPATGRDRRLAGAMFVRSEPEGKRVPGRDGDVDRRVKAARDSVSHSGCRAADAAGHRKQDRDRVPNAATTWYGAAPTVAITALLENIRSVAMPGDTVTR